MTDPLGKYVGHETVISVDHGTHAFGIVAMNRSAVIVAHSFFRETKNLPLGHRLAGLRDAVVDMLYAEREHHPVLAVERPIQVPGRTGGASVGQGFGICHLVAHDKQVLVIEIAPLSGKAALVHGGAGKGAMVEAVRLRYPELGITDTQEDLADACGICLAALPIVRGEALDLADRRKAERDQRKMLKKIAEGAR